MTETLWFLLPDIMNLYLGRTLNLFQDFQLAIFKEPRFQFKRVIKMILNRSFSFTRNNDDVFNTGGNSFLDNVLDSRLIDDRKHFLWHRLSRGKKARS
ncbi:hypothetical protein D3C78_1400630 [compost metagenome]